MRFLASRRDGAEAEGEQKVRLQHAREADAHERRRVVDDVCGLMVRLLIQEAHACV